MVVPLAAARHYSGMAMTTLTPSFEIEQTPYVMLTPQMEGISRTALGKEVDGLSSHRHEIISAIDFLVTGI